MVSAAMTMLAASMGVAAAAAAGEWPGLPSGERLPLMPMPAFSAVQVPVGAPGEGELVIGPEFRVAVSGRGGTRVQRAGRRLVERLARQTGLALPAPGAPTAKPTLEIRCLRPGHRLPHLGMDESYTLEVGPGGALLVANEPWGILRGTETFLQLVSPGRSSDFRAPAVVVKDRPRFPWRGLLLDSCRHFMSVATVKRTLDGMAALKLNVLHWHLSDDQGFRVETKRYPRLHRMGSDGLYYTQAQIRDVIAHASERGIRVVPEFDMPGHTTAWFVGHPELASAPGPYEIERHWGIFEPVMDPTKESSYRLLDGLIGEMSALFPDPFFHIGGDEVKGTHWDASPRIAAFKKRKGLAENRDLQAHFNQRLSSIVSRHGKQMMGWDEILHAQLPKGTLVQAWRNQESLAASARQGARTILSFGYYVDLHWSAARHYAIEPFAKGADQLSAEERARILGGEAAMWAEFVDDENLDSRIWPRTAAIAERLWSPREVTDVADMYARLEVTSRWLEWLGLEHRSNYRLMLQRLAGPEWQELQRLADVVEPLEDYQRGDIHPEAAQQTPLVRLVDAVRSESVVAREFAGLVDALLADPKREVGRAAVRSRLLEWQALAARLRPLVSSRELLLETLPLLEQASLVATAGIEALDALERGAAVPEQWAKERAPLFELPKKPAHVLEVAYREAVKKLVDAATGR